MGRRPLDRPVLTDDRRVLPGQQTPRLASLHRLVLGQERPLVGAHVADVPAARALDGPGPGIDAASGAVLPWNPDANQTVNALAVRGSTVYVGGGFTTLGVQTRHMLAEVDASTGAPTGWNPGANGAVRAFLPSHTDNTVFVGGSFEQIGGHRQKGIAAIAIPGTTDVPPAGGAGSLCSKC